MGDLVSRFRYPLTYLVLALASLLSIASPDRSERTAAPQQLVMELFSPLQQIITWPWRKAKTGASNYVALVDVRENLNKTEEEIARLRQENIDLREQLKSKERFDRLTTFREQYATKLLSADVTGQALSSWFKSITIDKGASSGVQAGMAVITTDGVVGVVSGVASGYAQVLLVSDPQSLVYSYAQRSRARGAVRGRSDGMCNLEYVPRDADVQVGDELLTSGIGGIYPRGLLVGTVSAVERVPYGMFQRVEVKPAVESSSLEEVFVILERRELPEATEFSAENDELWSVQPLPVAPATAPAPAPKQAGPVAPTNTTPAREEGD